MESEDLSKVLSPERMQYLAAARGDAVAFCRELLLRVERPDLAGDYDAINKLLHLADAMANASRE